MSIIDMTKRAESPDYLEELEDLEPDESDAEKVKGGVGSSDPEKGFRG